MTCICGIYKITNMINGHSYIGQSKNIENRWKSEKCASQNKNDHSYDYPLSRAFRKYGFDNFNFEILEECDQELLNERECYWIEKYQPTYNQTSGGDSCTHSKLTKEEVLRIQDLLINSKNITQKDLAKQFGVSPDTIYAINAGRQWCNPKLEYPLRKYDPHIVNTIKNKSYSESELSEYLKPIQKFCIDCGAKIVQSSTRCKNCENNKKLNAGNKFREIYYGITREILKDKIRNQSFTSIGEEYGVSYNAVKKWCDKYGLPRHKRTINKLNDEEWLLV